MCEKCDRWRSMSDREYDERLAMGDTSICSPCKDLKEEETMDSEQAYQNIVNAHKNADRIASLEAQLAAERERVEKAEEKSRNLQMICAWLSTEVTEGWLVRGLGVDRISIRTIRDHAIGEVIGNPDYVCPMSDWEDRALAAEAERDAMREALRKIVNFPCDGDGPRAWVMDMMSIARAAIAGEETA